MINETPFGDRSMDAYVDLGKIPVELAHFGFIVSGVPEPCDCGKPTCCGTMLKCECTASVSPGTVDGNETPQTLAQLLTAFYVSVLTGEFKSVMRALAQTDTGKTKTLVEIAHAAANLIMQARQRAMLELAREQVSHVSLQLNKEHVDAFLTEIKEAAKDPDSTSTLYIGSTGEPDHGNAGRPHPRPTNN